MDTMIVFHFIFRYDKWQWDFKFNLLTWECNKCRIHWHSFHRLILLDPYILGQCNKLLVNYYPKQLGSLWKISKITIGVSNEVKSYYLIQKFKLKWLSLCLLTHFWIGQHWTGTRTLKNIQSIVTKFLFHHNIFDII